jgi:hypothetical protein
VLEALDDHTGDAAGTFGAHPASVPRPLDIPAGPGWRLR